MPDSFQYLKKCFSMAGFQAPWQMLRKVVWGWLYKAEWPSQYRHLEVVKKNLWLQSLLIPYRIWKAKSRKLFLAVSYNSENQYELSLLQGMNILEPSFFIPVLLTHIIEKVECEVNTNLVLNSHIGHLGIIGHTNSPGKATESFILCLCPNFISKSNLLITLVMYVRHLVAPLLYSHAVSILFLYLLSLSTPSA